MRIISILLAISWVTGCDGGHTGVHQPDGSPGFEPERPRPPLPPVVAHEPLTAVSGGTLAVSADGALAVAADPEQHRIFVVDLRGSALRGTISVPEGEPGRIVLSETHAFVALRTGGVAKIDLATAEETQRIQACEAPRGLALEGDALHVACAGGELVTLATADGTESRRVALDLDLRDVVVGGPDRLYVTTFRTAQVLVVEGGEIVDRWQPRGSGIDQGARFPTVPNVAWRTIGLADGGLAMLHQRAQLSRIVTQVEGGYGTGDGRCSNAIVSPAVTVFGPDGTIVRDGVVNNAVLAVDLAALPDGRFLLAAPGARNLSQIPMGFEGLDACLFAEPIQPTPDLFTAVAFDSAVSAWAFSRHPLAVVGVSGDAVGVSIPLGDSREDTGHTLFHQDAGRGIACASCHPEGGDDGHTWLFEGVGLRRTQHLRGGLKGREPFHWEGDLRDMGALVEEVMVKRMGGQPLSAQHTERLLSWIDSQPAIRLESLQNPDAVARGETLFNDPATACVGCHLADGGGDGRTYDVGTGGYFQVPALRGLALRAPYLHDGCATTLHDRFGPCGGGDRHGVTSHLNPADVDDLVAFLKTL